MSAGMELHVVNDQITVGAAAVMAALTVGTLGSRWYVKPLGQHRAPTPVLRDVLDEESLEELLPPWPEDAKSPVFGAPVKQEWRECPNCDSAEPGIRAKDIWLCGHCFHPITNTRSTTA